ncbi:rhodanese-like domain-containing protein [Streptomyces sp. SID8111]|uniref:rhodanese-like domain-containing protein n=1 Tax=Streptomyces sp. SID8111 TaxID=2706100 RepID=UPI0013C22CE1|nr:rhodanese-like domain-containing protein [Streptomyces sp. SID8111]NEC26045.1 rhodanese-like domain-containing protein [Streptomyces sp. SID8111]
MTAPVTPVALGTDQARTRLHEFTVIDVRTPGEYASGHLPGALNIPLDQLRRALPALRDAAGRGDLLVVCASGRRSADAAARLAGHGITAATLTGGTAAWSEEGHALDRPAACATRSAWAMERQVRLAAGTLVLLGLVLDLLVHPAFRFLSAGIAAGLVFSAVTNTCGMAAVLARLPHNRPRAADLDATLTALRER